MTNEPFGPSWRFCEEAEQTIARRDLSCGWFATLCSVVLLGMNSAGPDVGPHKANDRQRRSQVRLANYGTCPYSGEMAKRKAKPKPPPDEFSERVEIRISAEEKDCFQKAASRYGLSLSMWIRLACRYVVTSHDGKVEVVEFENK